MNCRLLLVAFAGLVVALVPSNLLLAQPAGNKGTAIFLEPITVVGTATNHLGQPIADAEIYLASVRFRQQLMAETKTDAQGNYRFEKVELPIEQSDRRGSEDYGVFEVFGAAKGYSTTWRGQRWYYPDRRAGVGRKEVDLISFAGEQPIRQDLIFRPPAPLSGKVVDEDGKPIAGTKVVLFGADPVSIGGYDGEVEGDTIIGKEEFTGLYLSSVIPEDMRLRFTDEQGRFSFDNARGETRFRVFITPPGFAKKQIYAETINANKSRSSKGTQYDGMTIVFRKLHRSVLTFVYDDTGKPAKNVYVNVYNDDARESGTTDANGQIDVRLPAGEYKVGYRTEFGTPYYSRHSSEGRIIHQIREESNVNPLTVQLERTATVQITIVSDPIGRPLTGVDIWVKGGDYSGSYAWRSWKPPNLSSVERPRTNADGKMQVFLPEGTYTIGAGNEFTPAKHEPDVEGVNVPLKAGEVKSLRLKLKRRGARQ